MFHPYFPYREPLNLGGISCLSGQIIQSLEPCLTPKRINKIDEVLQNRTYTILPVLDGLYDIGNMNAVLRTSESFGFQAVHIIETSAKYREANRVAQGAEKWLDIFRWKKPLDCIFYLKEKGYKICVTSLNSPKTIGEVDFLVPTAIVFGNEHEGVSKEIIHQADESIIIPMYGFTQSFNISVAASIVLYHAFQKRIDLLQSNGDLYENEKQILKAIFYWKSLSRAKEIVSHALKKDFIT
ncbi:MAG: TrmH family RNA methyltransferase [Candidatus Hydrogenedens sp.]